MAASLLAALALAPLFLGFGIPMAVRRQAAGGAAEDVLRASRTLIWPMGFVAVGLGAGAALWLLPRYGAPVQLMFVVAMLTTPAFVWVLCDQSYLIVKGRYRNVAYLQLTQPGVNALSIASGALLGRLTVEWALASYSIATICAALASSLLAGVSVRGTRIAVTPLVREGLTYAGSQLAEAAGNRLDQVLAVSIIGATQAGYYAVAVAIAAIPVSFGHAIGAALFRDLASSGSRARGAQARALRLGMISGVIVGGGLAALSSWAVPVVFGSEFRGAAPSVLLLLCSAPATVGGYVATIALAAQNRGAEMTVAQALGLVVGIALLYILGSRLGAIGAAAASVVGYWSAMAIAVARLRTSVRSLLLGTRDVRDLVGVLLGRRSRGLR